MATITVLLIVSRRRMLENTSTPTTPAATPNEIQPARLPLHTNAADPRTSDSP